MDNLDKELAELKTFIADLKADRAAQKEKEKRESWTKYVSMSLVFIAVLAAIATQWAGKYSGRVLVKLNESTYKQALASDKWSYYQANSIKLSVVENLHTTNSDDTAYQAKVKKYTQTRDQTKAEAEALEKDRDTAQATATDAATHGAAMGLVTSIFQISIAMGSICLVAKKKWLWYVCLALATAATVKMVMVWM